MKDDRSNARLINMAYSRWLRPLVNPREYGGVHNEIVELRRRESLSWTESAELQWNSLKTLLAHAYETTPFYRQRFQESGITPDQIQSPSDMPKLGVLTRADIKAHLEGLWSRRYRREELLVAATGGTTDTPVTLLRSPECMRKKLAVQECFDSWAGMRPGDKIFRLWGAQQDFDAHPTWRWRLYDRYFLRNVWAPTSLINPEILESYRNLLNEFRPRIIYAYPTPLELFCEYLRDCGKPYDRPISAICTAEPLLEQQRHAIERTLDCRVFEHYGTRDFGMVGAECEAHHGVHLNSNAVFVEFVPVEGSEGEGLKEILITDLLNLGFPMIRYRINDCVIQAAEPCSCGRPFPLIKRIVGRTVDNFRLPSGSVLPGVALTNRVLQVCPALAKTQIIQERLDGFRIRYVRGPNFSTQDLQILRGNLGKFITDPVQWTFEEVPDIPRERSGKTRFCISLLSSSAKV